jgi:alpha-ketoglutarate-dependent taurine dioxygenase
MSDKRQEEANALGREQAVEHKAGTAGARRAEARAAVEHDANELIACSALEVVWTLDGKKRVIASADLETVSDVTKVSGARQPLVRTHPETGRNALFLGRRINAYVVGLPVEDSEALLDFLWEHTVQKKFTWRQEWRVGDLIWWDNRCAMHRRDAFDPTMRRLMHRTQLKGTRPV